MRVQVEVPLTLHLMPPPLITHMAGGMNQEQVQRLFPNIAARMVDLGRYAATVWKEKIAAIPGATGRPLRLGTGPSDPMVQLHRTAYEASVLVAPPEWEPSALTVTIYSDSPQATPIEDGTPGGEMDLHRVLPNAPKARKGRHGLYLRIPFRHVTQSAEGGPVLPKSVIRAMQPKAKYLMVGSYLERGPNVRKGMVRRFLYTATPGRLTAGDIVAINAQAGQEAVSAAYARRLKGLMRVGAKGHGGYLTIRTLSQANPEGWRIPAYPAQHLLRAVEQEVSQVTQGFFDEALQADVQVWLANAGAAA